MAADDPRSGRVAVMMDDEIEYPPCEHMPCTDYADWRVAELDRLVCETHAELYMEHGATVTLLEMEPDEDAAALAN
jgi:hypothetical protein